MVDGLWITEFVQVTGFGYEHDEAWSANMELFKELTDVSRGVRRLGAAAVDLCHVALGNSAAASGQWSQIISACKDVAGNAPFRLFPCTGLKGRLLWYCRQAHYLLAPPCTAMLAIQADVLISG